MRRHDMSDALARPRPLDVALGPGDVLAVARRRAGRLGPGVVKVTGGDDVVGVLDDHLLVGTRAKSTKLYAELRHGALS